MSPIIPGSSAQRRGREAIFQGENEKRLILVAGNNLLSTQHCRRQPYAGLLRLVVRTAQEPRSKLQSHGDSTVVVILSSEPRQTWLQILTL